MMIPDLAMSGPYFNADGSPNAAGLQLLRVVNAVKARTGGMVSEGVSEAEATATGGATQTLAEWFADVEAATSGLAAHIADTSDAHDASAISVTPAGTLAATDVQAGLVEILGDVEAHVADTSAAHAASAISYNGGTGMSATDVEAAIDELATEKLNASSYTAADVLSKLLTVDGAGSGLDADLLDGNSSAAFMQTTWTLTAGLGISGGGSGAANRTIAFDPSELTDVAIVSGDGLVFMDVSDSNNPKRRTVSSLISDLGIWTSGNDGAGSGLDADLLDGLSSAAFAQLAASNTFTGGFQFSSNTFPGWGLIETGASADNKRWHIWANSGVFLLQAVNDANSGATTFMSVSRSGLTVTAISLTATDITLNGALAATTILGRVLDSAETGGTLTSASRNRRVVCASAPTLPASGMTSGDFILLDPGGTARTVTRPAAHTMYIYDTDSATGTTRAHNVALAVYHGSSKWTLHGMA